MTSKRILAFDFGASSGRAILGTFDGQRIQMEEIHRFSNDPVMINGVFQWDVLRLFFEIKQGITKAVHAGGFDAIGIDTWGVDYGLVDAKGHLMRNPVHYRDTRTLMRWAFNNFRFATVLAKSEILATVGVRLSWSTDRVNLIPATEFSTVVENKLAADQVIRKVTLYEREIDAPVEKGRVLGKVELIVNVDQKLGEVDLVAADEIERNWLLYAWSGVQGFFTSIWFWVGIGVLILLIIGYIILNIVYNRRRRRDRLTKVGRQR